MQSLQLAIHWFRGSGNGRKIPPENQGRKALCSKAGCETITSQASQALNQKREGIDHDLRSICLRSITVSF
jgi:hypothetical protein